MHGQADALVDDTCGGTTIGAAATPGTAPATPPAGLSTVWNGMIVPFLNMRLSGVVFYQGESNSLAGCPSAYACSKATGARLHAQPSPATHLTCTRVQTHARTHARACPPPPFPPSRLPLRRLSFVYNCDWRFPTLAFVR